LDIIDYLITHITPLPWTVKGPGFLLMAMLGFKAIGQFLSFRWIKAATSLVTIVIVCLAMARFGTDIAQFIDEKWKAPKQEEETTT